MELQGTEAHDQMLGKVFGYAAIVRCKRPIDQETAVKCAEGLVHIANKKSFLRELAANVLLDLTGDHTWSCMHASGEPTSRVEQSVTSVTALHLSA